MSELPRHLFPKEIMAFFDRQSLPCANKASLSWVLQHWPALEENVRTVSTSQIREVTTQMRPLPAGQRRQYKQALENILVYLNQARNWHVPQTVHQKANDVMIQRFEQISRFAHHAERLVEVYYHQRQRFLKQRATPCTAFTTLAVAMEVAPLSISHLTHLINARFQHVSNSQRLTINIKHQRTAPHDEAPLFSRYSLPLFVYRVLSDYDKSKPRTVTEKQLLDQLNDLISQSNTTLLPMSKAGWQVTFLAVWKYRDQVPPTFLLDIATPERHASYENAPPSQTQITAKLRHIYRQDWDVNWFTQLGEQRKKVEQHWPHKQLIKALCKKQHTQSVAPEWQQHNILPKMLYLYTEELFIYGGMQKETLANSTIKKYVNIIHLLEDKPLSYSDACDPTLMQQWGQQVFNALNSDAHRQVIRYFFRFLQRQPLTDHFDASLYTRPFSTPSVDPLRLSLAQLYQLVDALFTQPNGHPMQRLFCAAMAILSYFAMLRRGEILRLRKGDLIVSAFDNNLFTLYVTRTQEGSTKSRKSRRIHLYLPEYLSAIIHELLKIKEQSDNREPLIGFCNEQWFSRQLYYLLPVTRAIKAICGTQAKFHHLRHSGVHLFTLQALHLAYSLTPEQTTDDPYLQPLLSKEVIERRFRYWLEGRAFKKVNDNLLLDELTRQIGHGHYATTRWSYLHDIDWLYPFYRCGYGPFQERQVDYLELRYLLGLSATSNDVYRQGKRLSITPESDNTCRNKSGITTTEHRICQQLFSKRYASEPTTKSYTSLAPDHWHNQWLKSISNQHSDFLSLATQCLLEQGKVNWAAFSQLWHTSGRHQQQTFSPADRKHLKMMLAHMTSKQSLSVSCSRKSLKAISTLFAKPYLRWLTFTLKLSLNRKSRKYDKIALIERYFPNHDVEFKSRPSGATRLEITLTQLGEIPSTYLELLPYIATKSDEG
ncbi:hypothetical protein [Parashewanella tropica]|uniref:hypothetical protein n=1 Tax=Parashewanella tropica TaxID=2547970 RepID=UPI00105A5299|nr:hypothetical protein [Parashewanella tropica]